LAGLAGLGADYPAAPILAEFDKACAVSASHGRQEEAIVAGGWTVHKSVSGGRLHSLVGAMTSQSASLRFKTYQKAVAGRTLHLLLTDSSTTDGAGRLSCVVYDFDAQSGVDPAQAREWAGRPAEMAEKSSGRSVMAWAPGLRPGHASDTIIFFAPGAAKFGGVDFSGLVLSAKYKESGAE
jgi:hypothetical protein